MACKVACRPTLNSPPPQLPDSGRRSRIRRLDPEEYEQYLSCLEIGKMIGKGDYGRVHALTDPTKVVKLQSPRNKEMPIAYAETARQEAEMLQRLTVEGIPHITRLFEARSVPGRRHAIVMQRAPQNIYELYNKLGRKIPIDELESCIKMYLETLQAIHKRNISHLDLKLENVTYKDDSRDAVIMDWGLAQEGPARYLVCSRYYRPPEAIMQRWASDCPPAFTPADMWSLGCMAFELYTGGLLFPADDTAEDFDDREKLLKDDINHLHIIRERLGTNALITSPSRVMLYYNDKKRNWFLKPPEGIEEILRNLRSLEKEMREAGEMRGDPPERVEQLICLIRKMVQIDPKDRISAREALTSDFFTSERSSDTQFKVQIVGRHLGMLEIYDKRGSTLFKRINLSTVGKHSCFHIPKRDQYHVVQTLPSGAQGYASIQIRDRGLLKISTEEASQNTSPFQDSRDLSGFAARVLFKVKQCFLKILQCCLRIWQCFLRILQCRKTLTEETVKDGSGSNS